jgi:hypothetical protein
MTNEKVDEMRINGSLVDPKRAKTIFGIQNFIECDRNTGRKD